MCILFKRIKKNKQSNYQIATSFALILRLDQVINAGMESQMNNNRMHNQKIIIIIRISISLLLSLLGVDIISIKHRNNYSQII